MTRQLLRPQQLVDVSGCMKCSYYERGELYELCKHKSSEYAASSVQEFHTCQHMREESEACGPQMKLIVLKVPA